MTLERTLDNGLRVIVDPSPAAPLAAVYLWFDAGASAERDGEYGLAHLLEHMLFKGTARRAVGEAAAEIEGLGGDLNAYTSFDETVLHATVAASAFEAALDVVADMARNATIDPEEFAREKPVVLEELRGYENDPHSVVADASAALLFGEHAYGRPILGTVASVTGLDREELAAFVKRAYCPDRTVLSIAGDVDPEAAFAAAERLLGDWTGVAAPRDTPKAEPPTRARVQAVKRPFETTVAEVNWLVPELDHRDVAALDVLIHALVDASSAPVSERLKHDEGLVLEVWSQMSFRVSGGQCSIGLLPLPGKSEEAIEALVDELGKARRGRLSSTAIARARNAILADFLFAGETVDGRANEAAWYTARMGGIDARERYRASVAAVTSEDVADVARRWLDPGKAAVVVLAPEVDEDRIMRCLTAASPIARPSYEPVFKVLEGGTRLLVLPEDSPIAACRTAVLGGGLAESPRTSGMSAAWARMASAGAGDLGPTELAEAVDDIAATLDPMSGRNSIGVRASFPAAASIEALDLVGSIVAEPMFDADEWIRVRDEITEDLRTESDRPSAVAWRASGPRLWPGHPWRLPIMGTPSTVTRLGPRGLQRWHRGLFTREALVIAVVGGVNAALVEEAVTPWVEQLPAGPSKLEGRDVPAPLKPGVLHLRAGQEQAQVSLTARMGSFVAPDRRELELAAAILGAQGGPLFLDLREKRSLAYQVWASAVPGVDAGTFEVGLAGDPARLDEAHEALKQALWGFAERGPTSDELDRYRRMTLGHAAMALQRTTGRAAHVALSTAYGLDWSLETLEAELAAVTTEGVADALRSCLAGGMLETLIAPVES